MKTRHSLNGFETKLDLEEFAKLANAEMDRLRNVPKEERHKYFTTHVQVDKDTGLMSWSSLIIGGKLVI